jgi:hypothetical protein
MRRTERGTSHEFRRFKRRMIPCAKNWGRSQAWLLRRSRALAVKDAKTRPQNAWELRPYVHCRYPRLTGPQTRQAT